MGKMKLALGVVGVVVIIFTLVAKLNRLSFAYPPPLGEGLLMKPVALSRFQSVPMTDPYEFEPDSMDRIEDVVEELKPAVAALTRNELRQTRYKIRPGDSLWEIARKNGIRTGTLLWTNSSLLRDAKKLPVGREVLIPNMDVIEVRLKPGETIWALAKRFSVNLDDILKFNRVKEISKMKPGDRVYVPNPNYEMQDMQRMRRLQVQKVDGFLWPSSYRAVNSEFGFRMHPIHRRRIFHEGIDIGGGRGTTVFASADGSVSFVGWMRGYGKIIVVRHKGGLTSRYAHLSSTRVGRGQRVEQGQIIGAVGATGLATGPNLHFEIRRNGLPVDPIAYLRRK